jgi:hypothetical protein
MTNCCGGESWNCAAPSTKPAAVSHTATLIGPIIISPAREQIQQPLTRSLAYLIRLGNLLALPVISSARLLDKRLSSGEAERQSKQVTPGPHDGFGGMRRSLQNSDHGLENRLIKIADSFSTQPAAAAS